MPFSYLPDLLTTVFCHVACWLQRRSAVRLPLLLCGILFASGRRTVTSWFRAAGIRDDFRPAYYTLCVVGRQINGMAGTVLRYVTPLLPAQRLLVAIDDTPSARYGPCVEGAGIHHNPSPGPAGEKLVYGHVWVCLAWLARHPAWDTLALPLRALLYVRAKDVPKLAKHYPWTFQSKL